MTGDIESQTADADPPNPEQDFDMGDVINIPVDHNMKSGDMVDDKSTDIHTAGATQPDAALALPFPAIRQSPPLLEEKSVAEVEHPVDPSTDSPMLLGPRPVKEEVIARETVNLTPVEDPVSEVQTCEPLPKVTGMEGTVPQTSGDPVLEVDSTADLPGNVVVRFIVHYVTSS
jgi:hypothetical protein